MRSSPTSKSFTFTIAPVLKNNIAGKDKSYAAHESSLPDWEETPKGRRPADEHASDFELDDEDDAEDPEALSLDKKHSRDEYTESSTSHRVQDR